MPSGLPTPVPRTKMLTTKLEPALHNAVARYADRTGQSLSAAARDLLALALDMNECHLETVPAPYIGTCTVCGWLVDPGYPCDLCTEATAA